jgi:hypothetical protein
MSGGGDRGAFEAGAIAHLVLDRKCDFQEISGISVGGLNAAVLAQARREADPAVSRAEFAKQAEALVDVWLSIRSSREVYKPRRFGGIRTFVFSGDSLNDFMPLRRLIGRTISIDRLREGRTARVGVVSLRDAVYREVDSGSGSTPDNFLDYVYAGAVLPIIGRPVRIRDGDATQQYVDASLRHITPILGYFRICSGEADQADGMVNFLPCDDTRVPRHEKIEQLFIVLTSPYTPGSDLLPLPDGWARQGAPAKSAKRAVPYVISALNDNTFRDDLDLALFANNVLAWQLAAPLDLPGVTSFHLDSYNSGRPYTVAITAPKRELVEFGASLDFSPAAIRQQVHDGCMAADEMMQARFHLASMAGDCERRFPVAITNGSTTQVASDRK